MENDETQVDAPVEETQETIEETQEDKTPTLEDYLELEKKVKTLEAQKEHFKKKLEKTETQEPNKIKEQSSNTGLSREEAILYAKGYTDEEVELATKLAKLNGVSALKATEDDFFQSKVEKRRQEELSKKASLGASTGGSVYQPKKPIEEMSRAEHEAYMRKLMG